MVLQIRVFFNDSVGPLPVKFVDFNCVAKVLESEVLVSVCPDECSKVPPNRHTPHSIVFFTKQLAKQLGSFLFARFLLEYLLKKQVDFELSRWIDPRFPLQGLRRVVGYLEYLTV